MVWTALMAAMTAIIGQHLGLYEKIAEIALQAAKCPKCCTFWIVLATLLLYGCNIIAALTLAMLLAYLSFWAGLFLIMLPNLYNRIWDRINKENQE